MKLITDINGNVEMIPKTLMIGITIAILWVITLVIPPVFQIIPSMATILDTSGSLYYDVETTFNTAVKMWYFFFIKDHESDYQKGYSIV